MAGGATFKETNMTKVYFLGKLFGSVVSAEEYQTMSADDLRAVIAAKCLTVIRCPDGSLDTCNLESGDYTLDRD
jgi:hypothetical protein